MKRIKKIKIFYMYLTITIVIVVIFIFFMPKKPTAQDIHVDTSDWKIWTWNAICGDFDIKYAPGWHVQMSYSGGLGCNGIISHLPAEYRSLDKASKGIVIRLSYSKTSVVAETTTQNIEEKVVKFPERSFFPSMLRCIKTRDIEKNLTFIECYVNTNKGSYVFNTDIKNDSQNIYETQIRELLESFKIHD